MSKDKIIQIIEMRLNNIPYSIIAHKLGESESNVKTAAQSAIKHINKEDIHKKTELLLSHVPYTNVVRYLRDNSMTARDLAKLCGVSVQYMCICLKDKNGMPVQQALRIAKATGMSLSEVYCMDAV